MGLKIVGQLDEIRIALAEAVEVEHDQDVALSKIWCPSTVETRSR